MSRTVTLVLVDAAGELRGALPPHRLELPFWQESADLVAAVRERDGIDVDVLRLLDVDRPAGPGGHLTMLAQARAGADAAPLEPITVDLSPRPRRAPWAVPGGPAAAVHWARDILTSTDTDPGTGGVVAVQQRTWNLSAVWRFDVAGSPVAWLKQVPAFFAHEAPLLRLLGDVAPGLAPTLLAAGPHGCQLLAHVPGEDAYGAGFDLRSAVAEDWHRLQRHFVDRCDELVALGVPDQRSPGERLAEVAAPFHAEIDGLGALLAGLLARLDAIRDCGLPDTLVHGDLHPGNVRVGPAGRVLLDWGDAVVAHPAYDILRLIEGLTPTDAEALLVGWARRWQESVPGSAPRRALELLRPVAELRMAAVYAGFLANIEESERPYHQVDVPERLAAAVTVAGIATEGGIP